VLFRLFPPPKGGNQRQPQTAHQNTQDHLRDWNNPRVMQHLIDTPIKIATCNRCAAYVMACDVSGVRTMADPTPLGTPESLRDALLDGKAAYRVLHMAGKPWKLQSLNPLNMGESGTVVAAHDCGMATANNRREVEVVPEGPQSAPATRGRLPGGSHPATALAGAQTATQGFSSETSKLPNRAKRANRPRSKWIYRNCEECGVVVGDSDVIGVQLGDRWLYLRHDVCPEP